MYIYTAAFFTCRQGKVERQETVSLRRKGLHSIGIPTYVYMSFE